MLRKLCAFFGRKPDERASPWLVDRDGRIYMPARRVVLRAAQPK